MDQMNKNKLKPKVGIITFHTPVNYGAALQAYALKAAITRMGYYCEIIDYRWEKIEEGKKLFSLKRYLSKRIDASIRALLSDIFYFRKSKVKRDRFREFMVKHMNLSDLTIYEYSGLELYSKLYDVYIVGSDLVWNPEMAGGVNPAYFLDFVTDKTKIKMSYASSIGTAEIEPAYKKDYRRMLKNLDAIAVREKTTKNILENLTDTPIQVVLDPTLLLDKSEWDKLIQTEFNEGDYLLVYMVEKTKDFIQIVDDLSDRLNLRVISFSKIKRFKNETNFRAAGLNVFLSIFKNAKAVITNSFHGVAFSLIYEKEFWCVPHTSRGSRMIDLMKSLDINDRIIYHRNELDAALKKIDYKSVNQILQSEKEMSLSYLKEGINRWQCKQ